MKRLIITILLCIPFILDAQNTMLELNRLHQVVKGETLYGIAKKYNITEEELRAANPDIPENGKVKKGKYLTIPKPAEPIKEVVVTPEVTKKQAIKKHQECFYPVYLSHEKYRQYMKLQKDCNKTGRSALSMVRLKRTSGGKFESNC